MFLKFPEAGSPYDPAGIIGGVRIDACSELLVDSAIEGAKMVDGEDARALLKILHKYS